MMIRGGRKAFISPPFWDCPSCGQKASFGVLCVGDTHYIRECRLCGKVSQIALPRPDKKVIYLDQWVWSGMKTALENVQCRASGTQVSSFYLDLFTQLDRLTKLMLIVCPLSNVHEIESLGLVQLTDVSDAHSDSSLPALKHVKSFENIRRLLGHLTCGAKFVSSRCILERQVLAALTEWLRGNSSFVFSREISEAIPAKINVWLPLIYGALDSMVSPEELRALGASKASFKNNFDMVVNRWRQETSNSFIDWFEQEVAARGRLMVNAYREHEPAINVLRCRIGLGRFNYPQSPLASLMMRILECLEDSGEVSENRISKAETFFASEGFRQIPIVRIESALCAGLAHRLVHGGSKNWDASFSNDMDFVSAYLPYCDAMFIENTCADILTSNPARPLVPECDRVFSMRSKDRFLKYLNQLEASVSSEHRARVRDIYGDDWDKPAVEVFFT